MAKAERIPVPEMLETLDWLFSSRISELKPQNLIQAAQADLERKQRAGYPEHRDSGVQYAFAREHVHTATSVRSLLLLALTDSSVLKRDEGGHPKRNTCMLYSAGAQPLLMAAIGRLNAAPVDD